MAKASPRVSEKMGRPRLFDDDTERRMVMDAAVKVMARNDYAAMSIADILAETGLSTSSFYRHFASKEALLAELLRREADSARRYVERAVESAPAGSVAAVEAWLEAALDLFFEPAKAARASVLSTPQVMGSPQMTGLLVDLRTFPAEPLAEVLRVGHETKQLHSPTPDADAVTIFAALSSAATSPRAFRGDRDRVRAQVVRFAWPALKVDVAVGSRFRDAGRSGGRRRRSAE